MHYSSVPRVVKGFVALCLALAVVGCSTLPATQTPDAQEVEPSMHAYPIAALQRESFAGGKVEASPVEPQVPAYGTDPVDALNPDLARRLSAEEQDALARQGFVIAPETTDQIYQIYQRAADRGTPLFVTTDALLHTYHILYDYTLRQVEQEHLVADLGALLEAMLRATEEQLERSEELPAVQKAASRNLAFFAVAAKLLDPAAPAPPAIADLVAQELALVDAHAGMSPSPILGYEEDYSQYVPRGHYTRTETLERYFRAMMWLGRMMFRLSPGETPEQQEMGRRETRQALLMVAALHNTPIGDGEGTALEAWDRIYAPTVFFVGETDDLNVFDYTALAREVYGEALDLADLADDAQLDAFIQAAMTARAPRIVSSLVTDQENPEQVTKGFRFMGQRFVPDSYVFQQLVYDKIGPYRGKTDPGQPQPFTLESSLAGPIRAFPRGLDLAAVLDSSLAEEILTAEGDTDYEGYPERLAALRDEFADLPEAQWTENLYWNWLHTLRPLLAEKGEGYPMFMQGAAWAAKSLNAFLGSWTELRHDTVLYAKQSYTVKATGAMMPTETERLPAGYVEPELEVWARLLSLVRQTREGLLERGLLDDEFDGKYAQMQDLLERLHAISAAELGAQPLDEEQEAIIRSIGRRLETITTFSERTEEEITSEADERMAVVVDVHTDVNSGQVLQEGVGDPYTIYVVAPVGESTFLAVGGVFTHYEFKQPMSDRLTDEAWQEMNKPPLAPWYQEIVPRAAVED